MIEQDFKGPVENVSGRDIVNIHYQARPSQGLSAAQRRALIRAWAEVKRIVAYGCLAGVALFGGSALLVYPDTLVAAKLTGWLVALAAFGRLALVYVDFRMEMCRYELGEVDGDEQGEA